MSVFTLTVHWYIYYRRAHGLKQSIKKLLSEIYSLSVNPSIINMLMDLQTDKACKKKITRFLSSVSSLINLTYHRQRNRM
jgi:hypothetical protein